MARTKKVATEVVVLEEKDVGFEDLALKIAKPTLNTDKTLSIHGNFAELGNKIQTVVDRYKNTQLTEDNVDYVKTLKRQFVSLRTGIERERKEYKQAYIDPASKLIDSMCKELLAIVDQGESALGKQLDEYDQRRKDELTEIIKDYVAEAVEKHSLREEFAKKIEIKDRYYNKTQHEEDTIDDIEAQASLLEKEQKEYDSGVALINSECAEGNIYPEPYIRQMEYKSVSEILLEIKSDRKAKEELIDKMNRGEKITIGKDTKELEEELHKSMALAEERETRTRVLRVTYKPEQAKLMARFFKENKISYEFINTDF